MDNLTNLLFNSAEDVTIENWLQELTQGAYKYLDKLYERMDTEKWLDQHFGEQIPEHIKFAFGILYYGKRQTFPENLRGKARQILEKPEIKEALEEVFTLIPKIKDEKGVISTNKEPTALEISRAAKMRVEIMRDKILPEYKKLLIEHAQDKQKKAMAEKGEGQGKEQDKGEGQGQEQGKKKGQGKEQGEGQGGGEFVDLDSLPPELRKELEKEIEEYAKELEDKTKANTQDWQKSREEEKDRSKAGQRQKDLEDAKKLTKERSKREEEGQRLSDQEKFARYKAFEEMRKKDLNRYQSNLDQVKELVHNLAGQMANLIREDIKPRWLSGLRKGKDIDWDRFFISALSGFSDEKYWRDRSIPTKRSTTFTLVIDESGSMSGSRGNNAILGALVFMDVLKRLDIDFNVRGFGDTTYLHKSFNNQRIPDVKRNYNTIAERDALIGELQETMGSGGATADGEAVYAAVEDIKKNNAERNIIIVLTDGEGNTGKPIQEALENARQEGIKVIGVGIGEGVSYVEKNYPSFVQVQDIDMLPFEFKQILKRELEARNRPVQQFQPVNPAAKDGGKVEDKVEGKVEDTVKAQEDVGGIDLTSITNSITEESINQNLPAIKMEKQQVLESLCFLADKLKEEEDKCIPTNSQTKTLLYHLDQQL